MNRYVQAISILVVVGGVGIWPSWRMAGGEGVASLLAGGVICFAAAMVSMIPLSLSRRRGEANWWPAYMMGILLRIGMTLGLSIGYYFAVRPAMFFFGICVSLYYLVFLVWESYQANRLVRTPTPREA